MSLRFVVSMVTYSAPDFKFLCWWAVVILCLMSGPGFLRTFLSVCPLPDLIGSTKVKIIQFFILLRCLVVFYALSGSRTTLNILLINSLSF